MCFVTYLLRAEFIWVNLHLRVSQILVGPFLSVVLPVVDGVQYELLLSFFTNHMCLNFNLSEFFFVFHAQRQ